MASAHIYGLEDPRTGLVRYVGKSIDPPERLRSHLRRSGKEKTYCARWIRFLKQVGLEPVLVVLEGPCEDWEEAERRWIAFFGPQLTNLTSGGDGLHDLVRTPKHCMKIGLANKRRNWTAEMRENASNGQKKRFAESGGMTEVARVKQSLARKGKKWSKPMSDQGRANIAVAKSGKPMSSGARENMSAAHKARKGNPAWRAQQEQNGLRMKRLWQDPQYRARHVAALRTLPERTCPYCGNQVKGKSALIAHERACLELRSAREFLLSELANGPRPIREVKDQAREVGIRDRMIRRAVEGLGIQRLSAPPLSGYRMYALP